jgi:hypothetical protein
MVGPALERPYSNESRSEMGLLTFIGPIGEKSAIADAQDAPRDHQAPDY